LKFVVQKLGIDEFRRIVMEERQSMPEDPSWRTFFDEIPRYSEQPGQKVVQINVKKKPDGYDPLGTDQRVRAAPAGLRRRDRHVPAGRFDERPDARLGAPLAPLRHGNVRTTVEQNLVLRWVPAEKVVDLYND
jgi:sulfite reductase (ferredoxin)